MDLQKLRKLESIYDVCGSKAGLAHVYDASSPRGTCPLMKSLMSNKCVFDCKYCVNNRKTRQEHLDFTPKEMADTFMHLYSAGKVEGLFLSSAVVKDPDFMSEKMLEAVEMLRFRYNYKGYIHFKVLPGVSYDMIKRASKLSDRMSINIEAPSKSRLDSISSNKEYKNDILRRQAWIKMLHPNQTTQMIVGAADETDLEILKMADWEYRSFQLKRIYYSAFRPVAGTEMENKCAEPLERQNRLYNIDYMLRKYSIPYKDFAEIMHNDMLPRGDPKVHLANNYFDSPIDLNEAEYGEIIRIPGIGPKTANKIIEFQNSRKSLNSRKDISAAGVILKRAEPFLKIDGYHQMRLAQYA
jgi:predicted DNA-binding helix-hairpin-helix protein